MNYRDLTIFVEDIEFMRKQLLITILLLFAVIARGQDPQRRMFAYKFPQRTSFPGIVSAGEPFRLVQRSTTNLDSLLQGSLTFTNVSMGNVEHCVMNLTVISDTIYLCRIATTNGDDTKALLKQASEKYGITVMDENDSMQRTIYHWKANFHRKGDVVIVLTIDKDFTNAHLESAVQAR
jgi:hypothetical protein